MNWLKTVSDAASIEAVLDVVNNFLLEHPDEFWAWIPRGSRPTLVANADELQEWHRRLSDDIARTEAPNIRMQDLCVFFLRAAARAIELQDESRAPSNDAAAEGEQAG